MSPNRTARSTPARRTLRVRFVKPPPRPARRGGSIGAPRGAWASRARAVCRRTGRRREPPTSGQFDALSPPWCPDVIHSGVLGQRLEEQRTSESHSAQHHPS
jgi:hypothetical protein